MFPDLKVNDKATGTSLLIHGFWLFFFGTTSSTHFLMKHVTVSEYASMLSSDAAQNMSQSTWSKQSCSIASDWSDKHWIVLRILLVSVSAYMQTGVERKSDLICRKLGGGRICRRPGKQSSCVPVHDKHGCWWWCVGSILELLFWS